jgi:puromycin-sensitive aminopeptidase
VSDNPYRLPQTVVPNRYRLVLEPDLAGATFSGTVSIDVTARDSVDLVKLNAAELDIASVQHQRHGHTVPPRAGHRATGARRDRSTSERP